MDKPSQKRDAWSIVATDGSTKTIACKSPPDAPQLSAAGRAAKTMRPKPPAARIEEKPPETPEPGVDLAYLEVERDTAAKLIAGMQAMIHARPAPSSRRRIAMPSARTDLHEIFGTDRVCMVSPPKAQSKVLTQAPSVKS